jgi:spore coat protein U-like protein
MRLLGVTSLLLLACASAAKSQSATNDCSVQVRAETSVARLLYDPFAGVQERAALELRFTPRNKGCTAGIAIGSAGTSTQRGMSGPSGTLTYELQMRGTTVRNTVDQPTVSVLTNPNQSGETSELLNIIVPSAQFAKAGIYRDQVRLRLFHIVSGVPQQYGDDLLLSIEVDIPSRAQINLSGASSPVFGNLGGTGLDFGELSHGKEREAYIQVRATTAVMLTLSSENGSKLKHRAEIGSEALIPYSLKVDGQPVDLASGPKRIDRAPVGGLGADNYRMVARILETDGRLAGDYSDTITIVVEPK